MLRQLAGRSRDVGKLALLGFSQQTRSACTSSSSGSSIASLIAAVNSGSASTLSSGSLSALKASITPSYAAPAGASEGLSLQFKVLLGAVAGWFLYRADTQARSKDWIVDLSLDVLQAAWLISYVSFVPFRSVFLALRGIAPAAATPLAALRPAIALK